MIGFLNLIQIQSNEVFRIQIQLESELNTRFLIQTEPALFKLDSKHESYCSSNLNMNRTNIGIRIFFTYCLNPNLFRIYPIPNPE